MVDQSEYRFMCDPEEPFYYNPSPWKPVNQFMNAIPVFYLTNKLSDQQNCAIREEILSQIGTDVGESYPKVCCYVP